MATGTIILMIGMLIYSAVVEQSAVETEYALVQPEDSNIMTATGTPEPGIFLLWLQKTHTVSDQAFDSFVLFGQSSGRCDRILTSRRQGNIKATPSAYPSKESHPRSSSPISATNTNHPVNLRTWVEIREEDSLEPYGSVHPTWSIPRTVWFHSSVPRPARYELVSIDRAASRHTFDDDLASMDSARIDCKPCVEIWKGRTV